MGPIQEDAIMLVKGEFHRMVLDSKLYPGTTDIHKIPCKYGNVLPINFPERHSILFSDLFIYFKEATIRNLLDRHEIKQGILCKVKSLNQEIMKSYYSLVHSHTRLFWFLFSVCKSHNEDESTVIITYVLKYRKPKLQRRRKASDIHSDSKWSNSLCECCQYYTHAEDGKKILRGVRGSTSETQCCCTGFSTFHLCSHIPFPISIRTWRGWFCNLPVLGHNLVKNVKCMQPTDIIIFGEIFFKCSLTNNLLNHNWKYSYKNKHIR